MRRGLARGLAVFWISSAACGVQLGGGGELSPDASQLNPDAPKGVDASPDAPALGPWGRPDLVLGASNPTLQEDDPTLSSTAKEMVFAVVDATTNAKDLWYMSRLSTTAAWSAPSMLAFNSTASDETPRFADNDLTLYFASNRAGGVGGLDIYKVTRPTVDGAWSLTPTLVPGVNSLATEKWFMTCPGTNIYLTIVGTDIGQGTMGNLPNVCTELSSPQNETGTFLSADCKTIYFASTRSTANRLYTARRATPTSMFDPPEPVVDFLDTTGGNQEDPWLASDHRTFVFVSDVLGTRDVYISTR